MRELYIIVVTDSIQQAARVSQLTAFLHLGQTAKGGETKILHGSFRSEDTGLDHRVFRLSLLGRVTEV